MNHKKKFFLFKQSTHFCSVPWNHYEVFSDGSIRTCSKGKSLGNINQFDIDSILNNEKLKNIKKDLLDDQLNENCKGCHTLTTVGKHFDLRNHYNPMFKNFDVYYEDLTEFQLHGVDLHWDNTCNFKCIYCNSDQSSSIAQEQNKSIIKSNLQNIDKIIDMIIKNQHLMKEIYLSGGEPLLIKHNVRLLSQIENKNLPIRINSNISQINNNNAVFAEIKKFKNVLWTISSDTSGDKFNYIRSGGNWNQTLENIKILKKIGHNLRLNSVFFIGNVVDIFDHIEYFITSHGIIDITINQLANHSYLLARNAPVTLKNIAKEKLQKLLDKKLIADNSNAYYNIARCQQELDAPIENPTGYIDYLNNLDSIRNTNWREIFPELIP